MKWAENVKVYVNCGAVQRQGVIIIVWEIEIKRI